MNKATKHNEELKTMLAEQKNKQQLCIDSLKIIDTLTETAAKVDDFRLNLANLFHNLAILNPQVSVSFLPSLKEAYLAELDTLNTSVENIEKYIA
jgi:hypothetical protein